MLYLASASPRRRELLTLAGYRFCVLPSAADETCPPDMAPRAMVELLARRKAEAVAHSPEYAALRAPDDLILGADTVVELDGHALGKPVSAEEAAAMLRSLSGREHLVHTGFCVLQDGRGHCGTESARVEFYPLSEQEIACYLATGEPMDKAGAYGIQGQGALLVRRVEGDYYTVVGLPIARIHRVLQRLLQDGGESL